MPKSFRFPPERVNMRVHSMKEANLNMKERNGVEKDRDSYNGKIRANKINEQKNQKASSPICPSSSRLTVRSGATTASTADSREVSSAIFSNGEDTSWTADIVSGEDKSGPQSNEFLGDLFLNSFDKYQSLVSDNQDLFSSIVTKIFPKSTAGLCSGPWHVDTELHINPTSPRQSCKMRRKSFSSRESNDAGVYKVRNGSNCVGINSSKALFSPLYLLFVLHSSSMVMEGVKEKLGAFCFSDAERLGWDHLTEEFDSFLASARSLFFNCILRADSLLNNNNGSQSDEKVAFTIILASHILAGNTISAERFLPSLLSYYPTGKSHPDISTLSDKLPFKLSDLFYCFAVYTFMKKCEFENAAELLRRLSLRLTHPNTVTAASPTLIKLLGDIHFATAKSSVCVECYNFRRSNNTAVPLPKCQSGTSSNIIKRSVSSSSVLRSKSATSSCHKDKIPSTRTSSSRNRLTDNSYHDRSAVGTFSNSTSSRRNTDYQKQNVTNSNSPLDTISCPPDHLSEVRIASRLTKIKGSPSSIMFLRAAHSNLQEAFKGNGSRTSSRLPRMQAALLELISQFLVLGTSEGKDDMLKFYLTKCDDVDIDPASSSSAAVLHSFCQEVQMASEVLSPSTACFGADDQLSGIDGVTVDKKPKPKSKLFEPNLAFSLDETSSQMLAWILAMEWPCLLPCSLVTRLVIALRSDQNNEHQSQTRSEDIMNQESYSLKNPQNLFCPVLWYIVSLIRSLSFLLRGKLNSAKAYLKCAENILPVLSLPLMINVASSFYSVQASELQFAYWKCRYIFYKQLGDVLPALKSALTACSYVEDDIGLVLSAADYSKQNYEYAYARWFYKRVLENSSKSTLTSKKKQKLPELYSRPPLPQTLAKILGPLYDESLNLQNTKGGSGHLLRELIECIEHLISCRKSKSAKFTTKRSALDSDAPEKSQNDHSAVAEPPVEVLLCDYEYCLESLTALSFCDTTHRFKLAELYSEQKRAPAAIQMYEQVLQLDKHHCPSLYRLAVYAAQVNNYEECNKLCLRIDLSLQIEDDCRRHKAARELDLAKFLELLSTSYLHKIPPDFLAALVTYKRLVAVFPSHIRGLYQLANLTYTQLKDNERAKPPFDDCIRKYEAIIEKQNQKLDQDTKTKDENDTVLENNNVRDLTDCWVWSLYARIELALADGDIPFADELLAKYEKLNHLTYFTSKSKKGRDEEAETVTMDLARAAVLYRKGLYEAAISALRNITVTSNTKIDIKGCAESLLALCKEKIGLVDISMTHAETAFSLCPNSASSGWIKNWIKVVKSHDLSKNTLNEPILALQSVFDYNSNAKISMSSSPPVISNGIPLLLYFKYLSLVDELQTLRQRSSPNSRTCPHRKSPNGYQQKSLCQSCYSGLLTASESLQRKFNAVSDEISLKLETVKASIKFQLGPLSILEPSIGELILSLRQTCCLCLLAAVVSKIFSRQFSSELMQLNSPANKSNSEIHQQESVKVSHFLSSSPAGPYLSGKLIDIKFLMDSPVDQNFPPHPLISPAISSLISSWNELVNETTEECRNKGEGSQWSTIIRKMKTAYLVQDVSGLAEIDSEIRSARMFVHPFDRANLETLFITMIHFEIGEEVMRRFMTVSPPLASLSPTRRARNGLKPSPLTAGYPQCVQKTNSFTSNKPDNNQQNNNAYNNNDPFKNFRDVGASDTQLHAVPVNTQNYIPHPNVYKPCRSIPSLPPSTSGIIRMSPSVVEPLTECRPTLKPPTSQGSLSPILTRGLSRRPSSGAKREKSLVANNQPGRSNLTPASKASVEILGIPVNIPVKKLFLPSEIQISHRIGSGGFGTVYCGRVLGLDRKVALKEFDKQSITNSTMLKQFLAEIQMFNRLTHPNLVEFLGACLSASKFCIVTELCENGSLYTRLHKRKKEQQPLTWTEKKKIALGICLGVDFLHSRQPKVVHRDLKSLNVVLDNNQSAKLCDFGLTAAMDANQTHLTLRKGNHGGSPRYMAPEFYEKNAKISEKVDIWALGCVLCEVFGTDVPYAECNEISQIIARILVDKKTPLLPQLADRSFLNVLQKCFSFEPKDRPSAEMLVRAVTELGSNP